MIYCMIDGAIAYPSTSSDIKITLQNPFIKDGDEKTMEVVFPMEIAENREIFGNLNRLDTNFLMENFENCRLMADGYEVIAGTGTITSVTNTEVKMQILAGKSYLRYKASFDNVYIDEIDYGELLPRHEHLKGKPQSSAATFNLVNEINNQGFVGDPGRYAFLPIHDETNDWHINMPVYLYDWDRNAAGVNINFRAIQPNLIYVLETVMDALGYSIKENAFDVAPWNTLYVASAKMTTVMSKALPHWTAYQFLDEIRKLFNATFIFDELQHQVSIIPFGESGNAGTEHITPLEEFSTSFDEEGLEYLGASNLQYDLSTCDRDYDCVPQDVRNAFNYQYFDNINDLYTAFDNMTVQQKMTTLFHCPVGFFYGVQLRDDNDNVLGYNLNECGWFSPLVRTEGGSTVEMKIVPVAMKWQKARCYSLLLSKRWNAQDHDKWMILGGEQWEYDSLQANIECDYPVNAQVTTYTFEESEMANDLEYVTLQDVIEEGETLPDESKDESVMEVFFAAGSVFTTSEVTLVQDMHIDFDVTQVKQPVAFTDFRHASIYTQVPTSSMSLNPIDGVTCVGSFHNAGIKIRQNINGNNEICIKFLYDGKPDPRKVYIIRNRKFICSKIEMALTDTGMDRVKTGYFYEML